MEAQLSARGGKGSTEVDLELVLHKSGARVGKGEKKNRKPVAVVNAKMEPW